MFTVDSVVAKTWADAVKKGEKKLEEVPNLSNLIDIVTQIVEGDEANV
ncbi:hypothetical protein MHZ92_14270 [Sporosarcina sp. ACRSL]|nr:hypothetical protein [Sporosarcina sp. ACRSL]MCG7345301.1 hypothetical protein [Sporosarcina sp. ACRSL]